MKEKDTDELWMMQADGSGLHQLTHYPEGDTTITQHGYYAGRPRRTSSITYQSKQAGKYSMYAVKTDGKRTFKLLDNPQNEGYHDWSPDGKWLALELFDDAFTTFDIYLMNYETKELQQLTSSDTVEQAPVFVRY